MISPNNRMFIDRRKSLNDEDYDAILGVLLREGPYVCPEEYDSFLVFSDPAFLAQELTHLNSYEVSKTCSSYEKQLWSAWYRDLEKEAAAAVTIMTLRDLGFHDEEIVEFMKMEPDYFDVTPVTLNAILSGMPYRNQFFDHPKYSEIHETF